MTEKEVDIIIENEVRIKRCVINISHLNVTIQNFGFK